MLEKIRIVLKLGTRVLTREDGGLATDRIDEFFSALAPRIKSGVELVLVTSGAVGLGRKTLGLNKNLSLSEKQACASVGQVELMQYYKQIAKSHGFEISQILLTEHDFSDRTRYLNLRSCLEDLMKFKVIPILNENDPVSVAEIKELSKDKSFGDNDRLSALVAAKLKADLLIILTDVDGVFTENPNLNPKAEIVHEIVDIRKHKFKVKGKSELGRGGMQSKLEAARIAALGGVNCVIASGKKPGVLKEILEKFGSPQRPGTLVHRIGKISSRRLWIGLASGFSGEIVINEGAKQAILNKGASLLPAGVLKINGQFKMGEIVRIVDEAGAEVARGLIALDHKLAQKTLGRKLSDIQKEFENKKFDSLVHRDNMVVLYEI